MRKMEIHFWDLFGARTWTLILMVKYSSGDSENLVISKDKMSNLSKVKTDFDLLHSLLNYTRFKKVTFSHLGRNSGTRFFPDMRFSA